MLKWATDWAKKNKAPASHQGCWVQRLLEVLLRYILIDFFYFVVFKIENFKKKWEYDGHQGLGIRVIAGRGRSISCVESWRGTEAVCVPWRKGSSAHGSPQMPTRRAGEAAEGRWGEMLMAAESCGASADGVRNHPEILRPSHFWNCLECPINNMEAGESPGLPSLGIHTLLSQSPWSELPHPWCLSEHHPTASTFTS